MCLYYRRRCRHHRRQQKQQLQHRRHRYCCAMCTFRFLILAHSGCVLPFTQCHFDRNFQYKTRITSHTNNGKQYTTVCCRLIGKPTTISALLDNEWIQVGELSVSNLHRTSRHQSLFGWRFTNFQLFAFFSQFYVFVFFSSTTIFVWNILNCLFWFSFFSTLVAKLKFIYFIWVFSLKMLSPLQLKMKNSIVKIVCVIFFLKQNCFFSELNWFCLFVYFFIG